MSKFIDINGLRHYNEKVIEKINATIPTNISHFNNDSNYITNQVNDLSNYYLKTETYTQDEVDTKIANLIDSAPDTLNTLNELAVAIQENGSLIDTLDSAIGNKADKSSLSNYSLTTHSHTYTEITGTPTLATVATSGNYNDLLNKPTLFSGNYNDLTNKPTIPNVSSFITKDVNNLTNYTTTAQMNSILNSYATTEELNTALSNISVGIPITRID